MNTGESLHSRWQAAALDLGLQIVAPYELALPSGVRIRVPLLVKHFGGREGMLVVTDYSRIADWVDEIGLAGYGFSTSSEPRPDEVYDRDDCIAVLADWGWTGTDSERPRWIDLVDPDVTSQ